VLHFVLLSHIGLDFNQFLGFQSFFSSSMGREILQLISCSCDALRNYDVVLPSDAVCEQWLHTVLC
jgi:hypothetical protein